MVIIETPRLYFRTLNTSDGDALASIWGSAQVMKYCGGPITEADIIRKVIADNQYNYRTYRYAVFAIVQKSDDALVGTAGCKRDRDDPRRGELIYHFCEAVWGMGYASEAIAAYLSWTVETQCLQNIYASALPENAASIRILQKNGFRQNGFVQFEDTGFVPEPFFERHMIESD